MSTLGLSSFFGHGLADPLPQQRRSSHSHHALSRRIGSGRRRRASVLHGMPIQAGFAATCRAHGEHRKLSDLSSRPRSSNKRWPLTDDGARRVIKERIAWESQLRKNNPTARGYRWIKRSPSQMAQFLENGRIDYKYAKHVDAAIHALRKLGSQPPASYDFSLVMNPWVGRLSFKEMCIVLKEQRNWIQACDFFQWMKRQGVYAPSVIPYTILFKICGQEKQLDRVKMLYKEMLSTGCEPDEVVICTLICIFGRSGDVSAMLEFYDMLRIQGLVPPIVVYNTMFSSLYQEGLYIKAIDIWNDLRGSKARPNDYTYGIIINVYRKMNMFVEAIDSFEEMMSFGHLPDGILYSMVITMMGKLGRQDLMLETFGKMKTQGLPISKHTYTYLVHFFCKAKNYERAIGLFSEMQRQGCVMDEVIYGTIISIYGQLGLYEDAEHAFREMDEAGLVVTDRVFIIMASVRMKACRYAEVLELFDEMKSRGFTMSRYAWIIVLQCCVKQQRLSHAESVFQVMSQKGFADTAAYTCMFSLYKKLGKLEGGNALVAELEAHGLVLDEKLYGAIIDHFCSFSLIAEAELYYARMQRDSGLSPTASISTMLIQAYGKQGRFSEAESLYKGLEHPDATAMIVMFDVYDSFGRTEDAKSLSQGLMQTDLESYNNLIVKCVNKGALATAGFLCSQMMQKGHMPPEDTLILVLSEFIGKRQYQEASGLFHEAGTLGFSYKPSIYNNSVIDSLNCGMKLIMEC